MAKFGLFTVQSVVSSEKSAVPENDEVDVEQPTTSPETPSVSDDSSDTGKLDSLKSMINEYADLIDKIARLEETRKALNQSILSSMKDEDMADVTFGNIHTKVVDEYDQRRLNTKKFKKDHMDLYESYSSIVHVNSYVKVKRVEKEEGSKN